ncbi:hypothetical protein JCM14036_12130 [Desulfotomaculum defluvii]
MRMATPIGAEFNDFLKQIHSNAARNNHVALPKLALALVSYLLEKKIIKN